ncbi:hypothetical protein CLIB1444_03S01640 [[Candida] jaroonii]|uniref:Uncharacterized protein n=1 Tax=[Candida] jaroonii TaxID=467808 RepID=A0ACA9Y6F3_9ASCO|nr:hypothetical protein CLIB1444_03S01640 [[Candida] jaroonii]
MNYLFESDYSSGSGSSVMATGSPLQLRFDDTFDYEYYEDEFQLQRHASAPSLYQEFDPGLGLGQNIFQAHGGAGTDPGFLSSMGLDTSGLQSLQTLHNQNPMASDNLQPNSLQATSLHSTSLPADNLQPPSLQSSLPLPSNIPITVPLSNNISGMTNMTSYPTLMSSPSSPEKKSYEDNELKKLAYDNSSRSFEHLLAHPITSPFISKENHKQLLGLIWLLQNCETNATAVVPRNKIYANYVRTCCQHGIYPSSSTNFGRLIKILYPNLTIRRLGVKGQAKYHYCGIKLVDESGNELLRSSPPALRDQSTGTSNWIYFPDLFTSLTSNFNDKVILPNIYSFIDPDEFDNDLVDTFFSIYQLTGTLMVKNFRHFQPQKFFENFHKFQNILSTPILKLYTNAQLLEWVKYSDRVIYKKILIMILSLLITRSTEALESIKTFASEFKDKLFESFNKISKEFIEFKLKNSELFVDLLNRLIKMVEFGYKFDTIEIEFNTKSVGMVLGRVPLSRSNAQVLGSKISSLELHDSFTEFISSLNTWYPALERVSPRLFVSVVSMTLNQLSRTNHPLMAWYEIKWFIENYFTVYFEIGGMVDDSDFEGSPMKEGEMDLLFL